MSSRPKNRGDADRWDSAGAASSQLADLRRERALLCQRSGRLGYRQRRSLMSMAGRLLAAGWYRHPARNGPTPRLVGGNAIEIPWSDDMKVLVVWRHRRNMDLMLRSIWRVQASAVRRGRAQRSGHPLPRRWRLGMLVPATMSRATITLRNGAGGVAWAVFAVGQPTRATCRRAATLRTSLHRASRAEGRCRPSSPPVASQ